MLYLLKKALARKGSEELFNKLIPFCDFWKYSQPVHLKIFLNYLQDFNKTFPAYYRNSQNLIDEITQILVQNKIKSLNEEIQFLSQKFSIPQNTQNTQNNNIEDDIIILQTGIPQVDIDQNENKLEKLKQNLKVLDSFSEFINIRKPSKIKENSTKDTIEDERFNNFQNEKNALKILDEQDIDQKTELDELSDFVDNKLKGRNQKAKIFYKNLKYEYDILKIREESSTLGSKRKKKIKRMETRSTGNVQKKYFGM